jgi:hypothetical protein
VSGWKGSVARRIAGATLIAAVVTNAFGDGFQDYYERRYGGGLAVQLRFDGFAREVRERRWLEQEEL